MIDKKSGDISDDYIFELKRLLYGSTSNVCWKKNEGNSKGGSRGKGSTIRNKGGLSGKGKCKDSKK